MKKVLAFGTFDIFHPGHESYLKQARALGDFLVVAIARDQTVKKVKGKEPLNNEQVRLNNIQKLKMVDWVILGYLDDHYRIIQVVKPDIIALGYDQTSYTENIEEELKKRRLTCKVVRLKPFKPEKYKSSILKKIKKNR